MVNAELTRREAQRVAESLDGVLARVIPTADRGDELAPH